MIPPLSPPFEGVADLAKTLSHPHRLRLLDLLALGEHPVETLAKAGGLSLANASQHLQALKAAGLVAARREGKFVQYRLGEGPIVEALCGLKALYEAQRHQTLRLLRGAEEGHGHYEEIQIKDLLERLKTEDLVLIDVRSEDNFANEHLPGAIHMPLDLLLATDVPLSKERAVVAYCRGPLCVLSQHACAHLAQKGYRVHHLSAGMMGWRAFLEEKRLKDQGRNHQDHKDQGHISTPARP